MWSVWLNSLCLCLPQSNGTIFRPRSIRLSIRWKSYTSNWSMMPFMTFQLFTSLKIKDSKWNLLKASNFTSIKRQQILQSSTLVATSRKNAHLTRFFSFTNLLKHHWKWFCRAWGKRLMLKSTIGRLLSNYIRTKIIIHRLRKLSRKFKKRCRWLVI